MAAPSRFSRYRFAPVNWDADGRAFFGLRPTYGYHEHEDNRRVVVVQGDALWGLAARHFRGVPRPSGLWWVIADFQPDPIRDPTVALEPGRLLFVPSLRVVQTVILNDLARRTETL